MILQLVRFVFDNLVCTDEVAIDVRKVSLELCGPATYREEERTSSEEGFVVIGEMLGDILQEMMDYASLATGPFHKGTQPTPASIHETKTTVRGGWCNSDFHGAIGLRYSATYKLQACETTLAVPRFSRTRLPLLS